jgi:hypothetical protein
MSEEEIKRMNRIGGSDTGFCFSDPERHIIVSLAWKKSAFASLMLSSEEAAEKAEKDIGRLLKNCGYHLDDTMTQQFGGITADGFRYSYKAQDIMMSAECLTLKKDKIFYYFHSYYRTELAAESRKTLQDIFGSCNWVTGG